MATALVYLPRSKRGTCLGRSITSSRVVAQTGIRNEAFSEEFVDVVDENVRASN